jgi:D-alanyl-lipoteichoic acid acyltransferase DltB (MBOAT superfamily)
MWHRGFNHWLIKYLYIPLGGNNNIASVLCVVAFVAFWHDHTINIVFWALIISLFMIPEIIIKRYFRKNKKHLFSKFWFKYLACFTSSIYIYFLIICNLIGFGYGLDKTFIVLDKLKNNIPDLIFSIFTVMNAVMLMFYQRNQE